MIAFIPENIYRWNTMEYVAVNKCEIQALFGIDVEAKLKSFSNVFIKLFKKLSSQKQKIFRNQAKGHVKQFSHLLNKLITPEKMAPIMREVLKDAERKTYLSQDVQDYDSIKRLARERFSQKLKKQKQRIRRELLDLDSGMTPTTAMTAGWGWVGKLKKFSVGMSFSLVFGLIDNLGMFLGMGAIEETIMEMGYDATVAAGLGNTFSDALGALAGGMVASFLYKHLKVKGEGTTTQQVLGVTIGCLIPVFIKMAIILTTGTTAEVKEM